MRISKVGPKRHIVHQPGFQIGCQSHKVVTDGSFKPLKGVYFLSISLQLWKTLWNLDIHVRLK